MKNDVRYELIPEGHQMPVGFFLNGYYYGHPFGDKVQQGKVDEQGDFYSFIKNESLDPNKPVAKIEGLRYIRLSDSAEFQLIEASA